MEKFKAKAKKVKRKRKHGFLHRMSTHDGERVVQRRRLKKRKKLSL